MYEIALDNLPFITVLVVLAGSLLGSTFVFFGGGARPAADLDDRFASVGSWRPAERQNGQSTVPVYTGHGAAQDQSSTRRSALPAMLMMMGLGFAGGSVGLFSYKSAWPVATDLRHLVATLHCDLADRVKLAPAQVGSPGYHIRNDRDGNGTSCEAYGPALGLAGAPVATAARLSSASLAWPTGLGAAPTAPVSAAQ
jgi:hypothetical protein